ncbi:FkbM family methyltransferase [Paenibacillus vulneris]|uniref:FkbM family methyltransferase n=1 Tax=Paenibacillus vulneris TaxID=1133364 RepID=A0ABW3UFF5_9BACL
MTRYVLNTLKAGQIAVDIGANVGYFSVLFGMLVGPLGKVIAYEANPKLVEYLNDSLSINYLHDRTIVCNKAVYSAERTIPFYANEKFKGNASVNKHNADYFQHDKEEVHSVDVPAERLDLHYDALPQIDLLKMDIEGGEYHAFLGMQQYLERRTVGTVVFELNSAALQNDLEPFHELLHKYEQEKGYCFYLLNSEGQLVPFPFEEIRKGSGYPYVIMKPISP